MNDAGVCPQCGARRAAEYRFSFNRGNAVFLGKLFDAGGPARTDDLDLTYAQRTNSQKRRYWGLAEPVIEKELDQGAGILQARCSACRGRFRFPQTGGSASPSLNRRQKSVWRACCTPLVGRIEGGGGDEQKPALVAPVLLVEAHRNETRPAH